MGAVSRPTPSCIRRASWATVRAAVMRWVRSVGWPFAGALGVAAIGLAAWPYTVDDAFIVARYARNLRAGCGYVMSCGLAPTDGVTGPLWVVPMLGGVAFAKGVGLLCCAAAAALAVWFVERREGAWAACAAALFVGLQPTLGIWGAAGLATGAATLVLTVAATQAMGRPRRHGGWVAAAAFVTPWLRPDVVPAVFAAAAILWQRDRRAGAWAVVLGALGLASVAAFRLVGFGHLLPLSVQAKPPELALGAAYAAKAVVAVTGGLALAVAAWGAARGGGWARGFAVIAVVQGVAVVLAGGDWMPGYRLLAPALPLLGALVGVGIARCRLAPWARAALLVLCFAVPAADAAIQLPVVREAGWRRRAVGAPFASWLGRHFHEVALVDAGYLPWASGVRVFDLAGLTDPAVARAPGGHLDKRFDIGLLAAADPDAIVLHSSRPVRVGPHGDLTRLAGYPVERRLAADPWVRRSYRVVRIVHYAPGYDYVVLAKRTRSSN